MLVRLLTGLPTLHGFHGVERVLAMHNGHVQGVVTIRTLGMTEERPLLLATRLLAPDILNVGGTILLLSAS